jgi:hypothetical protein
MFPLRSVRGAIVADSLLEIAAKASEASVILTDSDQAIATRIRMSNEIICLCVMSIGEVDALQVNRLTPHSVWRGRAQATRSRGLTWFFQPSQIA